MAKQMTIDGHEEILESQSDSKRDYVVLEEVHVDDEAAEELGIAGTLYRVVQRLPSRNAKHAILQVARDFEAGKSVRLIGVSERMFQSHQVVIEQSTRVNVG